MRDSEMSLVSPENIKILIDTASVSVPGCFVEVGVFRGGTAKHLERLALLQGRLFYAYDTFEGIPYSENEFHQVGEFRASYEVVKGLLRDSVVVKGIFPDSAVEMPPVAFAHIDCDQYRSIIESCKYLEGKMAVGGIMYFDDYGYEHLPRAMEAVNSLYDVEILDNGKAIARF